jgi:hypothetical protein
MQIGAGSLLQLAKARYAERIGLGLGVLLRKRISKHPLLFEQEAA